MVDLAIERIAYREIGILYQVVDHSLESHRTTVIRMVNACDAISMQLFDLGKQYRSAAAAEDLDMWRSFFAEQVVHIFEVLDVSALVRRHGDRLRIFLDSGVDHFFYRAVVPEVNHFAAGRLDDAAHDVDRSVVSVEKRSRRNDADIIF